MTQDERRALARALAALDLPHPLLDPRLRRRRTLALLVTMACCVALAGWIAILILTLPGRYTSSDWRVVWVGLDIAELLGFAATAWAAWHQRQVVIFFMIMTGTLLLCDAWFDLALNYGSSGFTASLLSALLAEVPLAFVMFAAARRLIRVTVQTLIELSGASGPVPPLWRVPLFADGLEECLPARLRPGFGDSGPTMSQPAAAPRLNGRNRGESHGRQRLRPVPAAAVLIAYRMTGSVSDAEDIVQEAFLRAAEGRDASNPKAYLATITTRLAIDHLRSARVRRESYVGTWLPEPLLGERAVPALADGTPGPAELAETSESLSLAFLVLLESLSPPERAVFLLREVFGYAYPEIADVTGKTEVRAPADFRPRPPPHR